MTDTISLLNNWKINHPIYDSDLLNPGLAVSPWSGHRDFAYDWLGFMKPTRIVELGTHYGCSFFAFAQACKDLQIDCELFAVDTWRGDSDAGFYNDDVYQIVTQTIQEYFLNLKVHMLRKSFLEALSDVADGTVSLLHIDGYHSYKSTKEDFITWRGKLAPDAVVFFHDIAPSTGYGSADYWVEVRALYPHMEFLDHSFGLGIIFPNGERWYHKAEQVGLKHWIEYYRYRSQARLFERQVTAQGKMLEERWAIMEGMEAMIRARDEVIAAQAKMLEERWAIMEGMEAMIRARDEEIRAYKTKLNHPL